MMSGTAWQFYSLLYYVWEGKSDMKNKKVSLPCLLSALTVLLLIYASTVSAESIGELESKKYENESNREVAEQQARELESSKDNLEGLVSRFNSELESLGQDLNNLESQIADKQEQIEDSSRQIDEAEEIKEDQYKAMKDRIQFLFESGDANYLEIFLSSKSLAESLNRAEYFSQLYQYDREMLDKYQATLEDISEKNRQLRQEKGELDGLKKLNEAKQQQVAAKIADSSQQIQQFSDQIAEAEAKAAEYERNVKQAQDQIHELEEEARRAEEERLRRLREESQGEPFEYSANDLDLLAALIQAEAEDQPYYGKLAVGAVVINRINSSYFPNSMMGVLYQPYQFTPVTVNNRFAIILAKGANSECYQAAQEVLNGNIVGTWLYFRVNDGSRTGEVIGDHVFY